MSMAAPAGFHGRQSPTEQRYEAHLFLTGNDADIDGIVELARRRRFRKSSRIKILSSGAHDILLTRNGEDEEELHAELRALAAALSDTGVAVYRIRLERMLIDEHRID